MTALRIGTSERDGTFWTQGQAIASLLDAETEVLDAEQASIENARRLEDDLIDVGFMASNWIGLAHRGAKPFGAPIDIRNVAPVNSGAMFFIVRADSSLRSVRDMVGRKVAIGPEGSGMVQHIHTIFGALGISFDDFTPAYLSFEDGGKALERGEVDAQWQCPYPNPVMRALSERMDVRVLDYPEGDLEQVLANVDYYRPAEMPVGFFRGVNAPTAQLAVVNIVATHARADDETVASFVSAMLANMDRLAEINPLFAGLEDLFEPLRSAGAGALEFGGVPLHPGAVQAYRDAGYLS